jgi:hypothetical protein
MSHLHHKVSALIDGELQGAARKRALNHLRQCRDCQHEVEATLALKHRLVEAGLPADEFHSLGPYTIYARDRGPDGILHQVLISQRESADQKEKQTLTTASGLGFADAGEAGMLQLKLHDVSQYTFVEQAIADARELMKFTRHAMPSNGRSVIIRPSMV